MTGASGCVTSVGAGVVGRGLAGARRMVVAVLAGVALAACYLVVSAAPAHAFGSSEPVPVPSVDAGGYITCGIQEDRTAACWGPDAAPGDPNAGPGMATPPPGVTFDVVNAGYGLACGVTTEGTVRCWGNNNWGQLTGVPAGDDFWHVAPGLGMVCALRNDGSLPDGQGTPVCWGGDVTNDAVVTQQPSSEVFTQLTMGIRHACGLRPDGSILCWGHNTGTENQTVVPPATSPGGMEFVPVAPCAVFDSRFGEGGFGGPLAAGESRTLQVTGEVPGTQGGAECDAPPADAVAVKINLVALDPAGPGNLRIAQAGVAPSGGVVNYFTGINNSNALSVEVDEAGQVDVSNVPTGADVGIRGVVLGYYTDADAGGLEFVETTPCAVFDSRTGVGGFAGRLAGGESRTLQVTGAVPGTQGGGECDAPPADAVAVEINLVAINAAAPGNLQIAASGVAPSGGVVNFTPGANNSNALPVEVNGGQVTVTNNTGGGAVHIRGVVLGYYTDADASGLEFFPVAPCAVFDTRFGDGAFDGRVDGGDSRVAQVTGDVPGGQGGAECDAPPVNAVAVEMNLVAIDALAPGNLQVAAAGQTPQGGVVNFTAGGANNSNALPVGVNDDGQVEVFNNEDGGAVHIRGVVLGYYVGTGFTDVNTGNFTPCAIRTDGTVVCWGRVTSGQNAVPSGTFTQVNAGSGHVCALRPDATAFCWGSNAQGQNDVPQGQTYTNISTGTFHTCGMPTSGPPAQCWGNNADGRVQPNLSDAPPPAGEEGLPYAHQFTMTTYLSPAPSYSVVAGDLPPGLALSPSGLLSGTPTQAGTYSITVAASNGLSPPHCVSTTPSTSLPCTPGNLNSTATATRVFEIVIDEAVPPLECGAVVTSDVTLTEDLGPCASNGLIVQDAPVEGAAPEEPAGADAARERAEGVDGGEAAAAGGEGGDAPAPAQADAPAQDPLVIDLNGHTITGVPGTPGNGAGILIQRDNVVVRNGTITEFDAGVAVDGADHAHLEDLAILNNQGSFSTDWGEGVAFWDASHNTVCNSVLRNNGPYAGVGVYGAEETGNVVGDPACGASSLADLDDVADGGNLIADNRGSSQNYGVRIDPLTVGMTVQHNVIEDNNLDGVGIFSRSTDNVVRANTIRGNGGHTAAHRLGNGIIAFAGSAINLIEDNTVTGNAGNGIFLQGQAGTQPTGSIDNDVLNNTSTNNAAVPAGPGSPFYDLHDGNLIPPCDNNTWLDNIHVTFNQECVTAQSPPAATS